MISARVTVEFGVVREYVLYAMERAGPPPRVTHCSHAVVGVVHGELGAGNGERGASGVDTSAPARNRMEALMAIRYTS
jgi:hypothetical protein